jgi:hypothetical protein
MGVEGTRTSWSHHIQRSKWFVRLLNLSKIPYSVLTVEVMHEQRTSKTDTTQDEPDTLGRATRLMKVSIISKWPLNYSINYL